MPITEHRNSVAELGSLRGSERREIVGKDRSHSAYSTEEWLAWRRTGVGGSDAPVILGMSPYQGWLSLYVSKTDQGLDPHEPMEAAYWGQQLEQLVALEFEKRAGHVRVVEPGTLYRHRDPAREFMIATPDRFVMDAATGHIVGILEIKTTSARRGDEWGDNPAPFAYAQLQHYLEVLDCPQGWIAVLIGGQRYRHYHVLRDQPFIDHLADLEAEFWQHVLEGRPPEPDGKDATTSIINTAFQNAVEQSSTELSGAAAEAVVRLRELGSVGQDREVDRLRNVIRLALGENEIGTLDGVPVVSWRAQNRSVLDSQRLRREFPEAAAACERVSTSRVLRVHNREKPGDPQYELED